MGVRRLFSRGGQKFSKGGQEPTFCQKNNKKYIFFPKKSKNILALAGHGRGGGQEPPLPSPVDAHVKKPNKLTKNIKLTKFRIYEIEKKFK
jgi:hypothetical protein